MTVLRSPARALKKVHPVLLAKGPTKNGVNKKEAYTVLTYSYVGHGRIGEVPVLFLWVKSLQEAVIVPTKGLAETMRKEEGIPAAVVAWAGNRTLGAAGTHEEDFLWESKPLGTAPAEKKKLTKGARAALVKELELDEEGEGELSAADKGGPQLVLEFLLLRMRERLAEKEAGRSDFLQGIVAPEKEVSSGEAHQTFADLESAFLSVAGDGPPAPKARKKKAQPVEEVVEESTEEEEEEGCDPGEGTSAVQPVQADGAKPKEKKRNEKGETEWRADECREEDIPQGRCLPRPQDYDMQFPGGLVPHKHARTLAKEVTRLRASIARAKNDGGKDHDPMIVRWRERINEILTRGTMMVPRGEIARSAATADAVRWFRQTVSPEQQRVLRNRAATVHSSERTCIEWVALLACTWPPGEEDLREPHPPKWKQRLAKKFRDTRPRGLPPRTTGPRGVDFRRLPQMAFPGERIPQPPPEGTQFDTSAVLTMTCLSTLIDCETGLRAFLRGEQGFPPESAVWVRRAVAGDLAAVLRGALRGEEGAGPVPLFLLDRVLCGGLWRCSTVFATAWRAFLANVARTSSEAERARMDLTGLMAVFLRRNRANVDTIVRVLVCDALATTNIICLERDSALLQLFDRSNTKADANQQLRNRAGNVREHANELFGPGWQSISAKEVSGDLVSAPRACLRRAEKKMVRESVPDFPSFCRVFHGYPLAGPSPSGPPSPPPPPPHRAASPRGAPPRKRPHTQLPAEPVLFDGEDSELDEFMEVDAAPAPREHRTLGNRLLAAMRSARPFACKASTAALFRGFFLLEMGPCLRRILREEPDPQALLRGLRAEAREWQAIVRKVGAELPQDDWITRRPGTNRPTAAECERKLDRWEDLLSRVTLARWHSNEFRDEVPPTVWGFALYLNRCLQQEEA